MKQTLKISLIVLNIIGAVLMLIAAYGGHVNPLTSPIPGIMLMLFPAFLLASVLLLILDLIFNRRLALIQGFAILFSAPAIWNICPLNFFSYSLHDDERSLKVMTYNVYGMVDLSATNPNDTIHRSLSAIIRSDADIVMLQETIPTDPAMWIRYKSQADTIVARYPYRISDEAMMAVWSRYPVKEITVRQPDSETSMIFAAEIDIDGFPLHIFNVHLQSIGLSNDEKDMYYNVAGGDPKAAADASTRSVYRKISDAMEQRALHAILLREQIDSLAPKNVIVAGDFNDIADCWAQRTIMGKDLHNTFTAVGCGPTISYNAYRLYFNIDHILYGGNIRPLAMDWGRQRSSDHFSVTATYAIPKTVHK